MSANFSTSNQNASNNSKVLMPKDVKALRGSLQNFFMQGLNSGSSTDGGGFYGGLSNFLLGGQGSQTYNDILSGNSLNPELLATINSSLAPSTKIASQQLAADTAEQFSSIGAGFGTDVVNSFTRADAQLQPDQQQRALAAALPIAQDRSTFLQNSLQSFLPQAGGFGTAGVGIGSFGQSGGSAVGLGGSLS